MPKKHYKIKITPFLRKKLRFWWERYLELENNYLMALKELENRMVEDTGIEDIEFFFGDNFLAVIKIKNKYAGFDLPVNFSNFKKLNLKRAKFVAKTLSEAFEKAEEYCQKNIVKYGIRYVKSL